jgi:hypothetical protein
VFAITQGAPSNAGNAWSIDDPQGSIYNKRTAVIIPTQQTALEPNEVIKVYIPLESIKPEVDPGGRGRGAF